MKQNMNGNDHNLSKKITMEEISTALKRSKSSGKNSDHEGIYPLMLKHSGNQFKCPIILLFNAVLSAPT